jgi:hypothetical protein
VGRFGFALLGLNVSLETFLNRLLVMAIDTSRFTIHPEVKDALASGQAVVALESTIISHGLPSPRNVAVAGDIEQSVRDGGAIPATIAIIDGVVKVGLHQPSLKSWAIQIAMSLKFPRAIWAQFLPLGDMAQRQCQQRVTSPTWPASSSLQLVV